MLIDRSQPSLSGVTRLYTNRSLYRNPPSFNVLVSDTADRVKRIIQSLQLSIGAIDHNFHSLVSLVYYYQRNCPALDLDKFIQEEQAVIKPKELLEAVPEQVGQTQYLLADAEHYAKLLKALSRTNHADLYEEHYPL